MKHINFNNRVKIEKLTKSLSVDNTWVSSYAKFADVWAAINVKELTAKKCLYLFTIQWRENFPNNFRVMINDSTFIPTQIPIVDFKNNVILFHAIAAQ